MANENRTIIMDWCQVHGIRLNEAESKQFNSLTYIDTLNSHKTIIAVKSQDIATTPHSFLLRLVTFFSIKYRISFIHGLEGIMNNHLQSKIFWVKKALFIDITLFSAEFLDYCHTYVIQCVFTNDIPISSQKLSEIQTFITHHQQKINFDLSRCNSSRSSNRPILYVTDFSYQSIDDIKRIFERFGSSIKELLTIPYEYISRKAKVLIRFDDPSKVKLFGCVLCSSRQGSNKYEWISVESFNRIKLENAKSQPWQDIASALREQQTNPQKIYELNKCKRSANVRARELYFEAIKCMIKSNTSEDMHFALEAFQSEGIFSTIPKQQIIEISEFILNCITHKNKNELEYDEYKYEFNYNNNVQHNMINVMNKQIQSALIEVLTQLFSCIKSNKMEYDYYSFMFKCSGLLENLHSSKDTQDILLFLNILRKVNNKTTTMKYFEYIINCLDNTNSDVYLNTLKTITNICSSDIYDLNKDVIARILNSLQQQELNGNEWEFCGCELYELIEKYESNTKKKIDILFSDSLNIFAQLCHRIFVNPPFKIAFCIWMKMCIKLKIFRYNNNLTMDLISNALMNVFTPCSSLTGDKNKRMYNHGISILKQMFSNCKVDVREFMNTIKLKSEDDVILITSVLLDCNLKDCILFAIQHMIQGNQTLQIIINKLNTTITDKQRDELLYLLTNMCYKMEPIIYEPQVNTMYVIPIIEQILELVFDVLTKKWQNIRKDIKLSIFEVLSQCFFLDKENVIFCEHKYFDQIKQCMYALISNEDDIDIVNASLKCVSCLLYVCATKYGCTDECNQLLNTLEQMYKRVPSQNIIECISYLISAYPSVDESNAMKIVSQILNENKNNCSEIILSLCHNLAMRVTYKTFKPLMNVLMTELLSPLEYLFNPKYYKQTAKLLGTELQTTQRLLIYLGEFLNVYGNSMSMAYIRRIISSLQNILHKSYKKSFQKSITSDIKLACYENLSQRLQYYL